MTEFTMVMLICLPFATLISFWAGDLKKIGFWWTLFFCVTLTPVIGYILAVISGNKNEKIKDSLARDYILFMLSGISAPAASLLVVKGINTMDTIGIIYLLTGVGAMGICLYCLKLAIIAPWSK